jgi:hypothetical protein
MRGDSTFLFLFSQSNYFVLTQEINKFYDQSRIFYQSLGEDQNGDDVEKMVFSTHEKVELCAPGLHVHRYSYLLPMPRYQKLQQTYNEGWYYTHTRHMEKFEHALPRAGKKASRTYSHLLQQ